MICPPKKTKHSSRQDIYDTSGLLIADSIIRNDDGCPKTFDDSDNSDPFLNEGDNDGPNW